MPVLVLRKHKFERILDFDGCGAYLWSMKKITKFKKEGTYHRLVKFRKFTAKEGYPYLVGIWGLSYEEGGAVVGYTVGVVYVRRDDRFSGGLFFSFPSSEQWGREAFSYYSLESSRIKFYELIWKCQKKIVDLDNKMIDQ